jgi:hypothetical protein
MTKMRRSLCGRGVAGLALCLASALYAEAQNPTAGAAREGAAVTTRASGPFDVKITPLPPDDKAGSSPFGRMSFDKQLRGPLEGTSHGEMLTAMSAVEGSGAYVAVERVSATLDGRTGTFMLHHSGVMTRGTPQLTVAVVPDSGTGELAGISGHMTIRIEAGGKHFYDFDYSIAPPAPEK